MPNNASVIVLAGRRIDALDAEDQRFPLGNVGAVARRIQTAYRALRPDLLVCSAANGADLTALRIAREMNIRARIVLPFGVKRFRRVSVTDRPGGELWGWLFDDLIRDALSRDDLIVLGARHADESAAFEAANERIVEEGELHVRKGRHSAASATRALTGIAVWDATSRGEGDVTAAFVRRLRHAGHPVKSISTL